MAPTHPHEPNVLPVAMLLSIYFRVNGDDREVIHKITYTAEVLLSRVSSNEVCCHRSYIQVFPVVFLYFSTDCASSVVWAVSIIRITRLIP